MEPYGKEAESVDVGRRLRQLRDERKVSMRALARRSGLSANALSMIERGLTSPSVSTLIKLANAMQVPITAFFQQGQQREKIVFRKASERTRVSFVHGLIEGLGGEAFTGRVEAFLVTLEAGGSSGYNLMVHTGHELVFVLRGMLEYEVEGQRFLLEAGDSLLFSSQMSHRWRNPGHLVVNAIIVISGYSEDESPREYHIVATSEEEQVTGEDMDEGGSDLEI